MQAKHTPGRMQRFRIAVLIAKREDSRELQALVLLYRRHEDWARRSGYSPMEWSDFKRSRLSDLRVRAAIARATGGAA